MASSRDREHLDVVEHRGYSEHSSGPVSDTTAYVSGLGGSGGDAPPVTFDAEKKPTPGVPSRASLRSQPEAPSPERAVRRARVPLARLAVLAALVLLTAGALLALFMARDTASEPAPAESSSAAPEPAAEQPREIGGVPVERGMNRKPLPPKQK